VELAEASYRPARILTLHAPTAVLTPQQTRELFAIMRRLAADGRSLIFISHKLGEVRAISNRIVVMRAGRVVGDVPAAEATNAGLATMMVGRSVVLEVERGEAKPGAEVLAVSGLHARVDRGAVGVDSL